MYIFRASEKKREKQWLQKHNGFHVQLDVKNDYIDYIAGEIYRRIKLRHHLFA